MSEPAPRSVGGVASRRAGAELEPYQRILRHAELELELAGRGEIDALQRLGESWEPLTAGLPERPPAAAGPLLQRAALIHERTRIELIRLREGLLGNLAASAQAKRAASGYGRGLQRGPQLDRSA